MSANLLGELFALITALCWTFGTLFFTIAAKRLGSNVLNHFRLAIAAVLLAIIAMLMDRMGLIALFNRPQLENWLWLAGSGILGLTIGDWFAFRAFEIIGAKKTSLFYTFSPGAALLFGLFLLNETVSFVAFAGIVITVSGVFWVIFSRQGEDEILAKEKRFKGVLMAMGGALTQGAGLVFSKLGMANGLLSPIHASWMHIFIAISALLLISLFRGRLMSIWQAIRSADRVAVNNTLAATVISPVLGVSLSLYAASLIKVSIAQTIFSLVPVFILPVAYVLYRETISLKTFFGAVIAVLGVLILIWRDEILLQLSFLY